MSQYVYTMNRVGKIVPPKREILKDISLSFFPGAKIGVLGLNGAGKSTLLRIMAGMDTEINGEARPQPGIKIGYLPQEPELEETLTVRENVEKGIQEIIDLVNEFNAISDKFAEPMGDEEMNALLERQGELQNEIDAVGGWQIERTLDIAADALRLPDWEAAVSNLSGGEKRRVALCRLLLSKPDMLLLDEPTASLDPETADWVRTYLKNFQQDRGATILLASHNMSEVERLCDDVVMMKEGSIVDRASPADLLTKYGRANLEDVFLDIARGRQNAEDSEVGITA